MNGLLDPEDEAYLASLQRNQRMGIRGPVMPRGGGEAYGNPATWGEFAGDIGSVVLPQGVGDVATEVALSLPRMHPMGRVGLATAGLLESTMGEAEGGVLERVARPLVGGAPARAAARRAARGAIPETPSLLETPHLVQPEAPRGVSEATPYGVNARGPNATPYGTGEVPNDFMGPGEGLLIGHNSRRAMPADGSPVRAGRPVVASGIRESVPLDELFPNGLPEGVAPDRSPGTVVRHNPARGGSARFADFQSRIGAEPELLREIMDTARQGEGVGRRWYNTEGTRNLFIRELGEEEGHRAWQEFMYRMGGSSPGSAVLPNIRQASYFFTRSPEERAAAIAQFERTGTWPRPPRPYGSLTQQYQSDLNRLVDEDNFYANRETTRAPKPRGFTASLMGNPENIAADKHFMRFIGMASGDPRFLHGSAVISQELADEIRQRFPDIAARNITTREVKNAAGQRTMQTSFNAARAVREAGGAEGELFQAIRTRPTVWDEVPRDNEYGAYERLAAEIARRMNMTPAQLQASLWMGAAQRTGVDPGSLDTFDNIFQRNIRERAAERGLPEEEVFRRFARRLQPLAVPGMAGGAAAGGLLGERE